VGLFVIVHGFGFHKIGGFDAHGLELVDTVRAFGFAIYYQQIFVIHIIKNSKAFEFYLTTEIHEENKTQRSQSFELLSVTSVNISVYFVVKTTLVF
jgi:hypothetical protein